MMLNEAEKIDEGLDVGQLTCLIDRVLKESENSKWHFNESPCQCCAVC